MRVARVICRKNSMTPVDSDCYYDIPDLFTPYYDKVLVSCTFTWDIDRAKYLAREWQSRSKDVLKGGPAFNDEGGEFTPGMFLKKGVIITSRGCPNNCSFCFVPKREGKLRELQVKEGNIIQDNNLLACSKNHIDKVFNMLSTQKKVMFTGGIEAARINDNIIDKLRSIDLNQIYIAYDRPEQFNSVKRAIGKLRKYFTVRQIRCYVLIGMENDTITKAQERLKGILSLGSAPFAMRYRLPNNDFVGSYCHYEREWNLLQREWTRMSIIISKQEKHKYTEC